MNTEMVSVIPDKIIMDENTELTMYTIREWKIIYINESNPQQGGVQMVIVLKRKIMNEMLTTYLPSILLMLITYATTFFKPFFFESALGVNLTTMLVMTTIFIAVMDKLPSTAYVKLVDYWLIFGQIIPFTEVVLLTAMEFIREGDGSGEEETQTVNHHGEERVVQLSNYNLESGSGNVVKV